jgi:hypothetical protein
MWCFDRDYIGSETWHVLAVTAESTMRLLWGCGAEVTGVAAGDGAMVVVADSSAQESSCWALVQVLANY